MPNLALGFDLETTGLDIDNDKIIEIGAILADPYTKTIIETYSAIIKPETDFEFEKDAEMLTELTKNIILDHGIPPAQAYKRLKLLWDRADFIVAHNGRDYDKPFFEKKTSEIGIIFTDKIWIDTLEDIEYPSYIKTRKLDYLAVEHGYFNSYAHRAIFDVMTMFQILFQYDFDEILLNAKTPTITVCALVDYEENYLAKENGYRWDRDRRLWVKKIKENKYDEEFEKCPFKIQIVDTIQSKSDNDETDSVTSDNKKVEMIIIKADVRYGDRQLAKDRDFKWDNNRKIWYKEISRASLEVEKNQSPFAIAVIDSL